MGKELDQQEIDLVAVRVHPGCPAEMVLQQGLQTFFAGQTRGLKELAQLMDLDLLVHFEKPLAGLFHGLLRRIFHAGFEIGARGQFDHKLPSQCAVQRMEQARFPPLRSQVLLFRFQSHGFTIQLETSWVKRATTAVRPLVYCRATTETSASSVPSEFCTFSRSANSSGRVEENNTSRAVPNSITVFSAQSFPSPATRVRRTGIRTGLASGKNFASLAVQLSCRTRARPVACVDTANTSVFQG